MPKLNDLTGQRFGRLVVLRKGEPTPSGSLRWICQCDCGKLTQSMPYPLKNGVTQSCGCLHRERTAERMKTAQFKHGLTDTKIHHVWAAMIQRCTNPNNPRWADWGGRGIKVCDHWRDFMNFLADMGQPPTPHHSIDRIDNSGNYEPGNCRWATPVEQSSNRRDNTMLTIDGETKTMSQWSRISGVSKPTICVRLYNLGWDAKRAVFEPVSYGRHPKPLAENS